MNSVIYQLSKLKRITEFYYPLDEIGLMVNHCVKLSQINISRYFFCFSFNKEKYSSADQNLSPSFSILPPGTVLKYTAAPLHDELFFSYSEAQNEKLANLFKEETKYNSFLLPNDCFKQNLLKIKELVAKRNQIGIADRLDALAMEMIMTAYADSKQDNTKYEIEPDAGIQDIAVRLKRGEKLDPLLRKYGYSRRSFYYEWNKNFSVSPKHIYLESKLEQAQKLLLTTKLSIAEIAGKCDFSSHRYFHEIFIKYTGETPGKYRKRFAVSQLTAPAGNHPLNK